MPAAMRARDAAGGGRGSEPQPRPARRAPGREAADRWASSALAEGHEMERTSAEQAATLPFVAEHIAAAGVAVGATLDIVRVDPDGHAIGHVLRLLFPGLQRRFRVAGADSAVASNLDRRRTFHTKRERFERVRWIGGKDGQ